MDWNLHSRVHPLRHFPNEGVVCYVKRDDELGFGVNGCKLRKYSSVATYLRKHQVEHLIIIAGSQSNNLLAALQVARELGLKVSAFLIKPWNIETKGNFALSQLFLYDDDIHWIERTDWHTVEQLARDYAQTRPEHTYVLCEGASVIEALPGAITLASDIARNEHELGVSFDHIFVDAGTGFTAAGLIMGLHELKHTATVHVLLLADKEALFLEKLKRFIQVIPDNFNCLIPTTARSFGSMNQTIRDEMKRVAVEEGILTDAVYSAKLFYEARRYIETQKLRGHILLIHSGGSHSSRK